ncbi:MAG: DUF1178 domain-containing protein [Alphaproteobacteria bacterium HGW-Alphaproteobacteria-2]|nr:MAG: DUF1178 domain-containing protein [Alphaproteobacteria bacterium HGW-Alphaproteobacteria-2]
MIRYSLRCDRGHEFESWFASAEAYDKLADAGLFSCGVCGSAHVGKAPMAPQIGGVGRDTQEAPVAQPLAAPASPAELALAAFRRHVEASSEDVGPAFAAEARRIHEGIAPKRSIRGEARPEEARALLEDGVPVLPLPWQGRRGTN